MVANGSYEEGAALKDGALAMVRKVLPRMDRDPRTWERVEGDLRLPAEADFLLVKIFFVPNYSGIQAGKNSTRYHQYRIQRRKYKSFPPKSNQEKKR